MMVSVHKICVDTGTGTGSTTAVRYRIFLSSLQITEIGIRIQNYRYGMTSEIIVAAGGPRCFFSCLYFIPVLWLRFVVCGILRCVVCGYMEYIVIARYFRISF